VVRIDPRQSAGRGGAGFEHAGMDGIQDPLIVVVASRRVVTGLHIPHPQIGTRDRGGEIVLTTAIAG